MPGIRRELKKLILQQLRGGEEYQGWGWEVFARYQPEEQPAHSSSPRSQGLSTGYSQAT